MKIHNNIITSIASLRMHFDFFAIWGQLDVFLRDMSPEEIPYPDTSSVELFNIIKYPQKVEFIDNSIVVDGDKEKKFFLINTYDSLNFSPFKAETKENNVRMLAIFELAGRVVKPDEFHNNGVIDNNSTVIQVNTSCLIQSVGNPIVGTELELKLITVSQNATCIIDGFELKSGESAFGVFSQQGFHYLLQPRMHNEKYNLMLRVKENGEYSTIVCNNDGVKSHLNGIVSFCTIGSDNFAYIENNKVYCHHDSSLSNKIRNSISILDCPLYIVEDKGFIIITMQDGSEVKVKL